MEDNILVIQDRGLHKEVTRLVKDIKVEEEWKDDRDSLPFHLLDLSPPKIKIVVWGWRLKINRYEESISYYLEDHRDEGLR
ncbi:hypothetical protein SLS62_010213 [Diatrype stigma]|uniref:Uncharacterized protein n=1 Tax=Diatrype stigma TaxID=117547 RepID=A0AAN9UHL5_9PEZI